MKYIQVRYLVTHKNNAKGFTFFSNEKEAMVEYYLLCKEVGLKPVIHTIN